MMNWSNRYVVTSAVFLVLYSGFLPAASALPGGGASGSRDKLRSQDQRVYQDYAMFIAGISNPGSSLAPYESRPEWVQHAKWSAEMWKSFEEEHLVPMRKWVAEELKSTLSPDQTLLYPFSGPDFVNMYTLFPRAKAYLMIALDPVGELPDFASFAGDDFQIFFAGLQRALYDLLQLDYFITKHLEVQLRAKELEGTLPVILFFMAKEGVQVRDVRRWFMRADGAVVEVPAVDRRRVEGEHLEGLRIVFTRNAVEEPQTLYYVRFNLDNDSFNKHPHFVSFIKGFSAPTTFVKAASYLMFDPFFGDIRNLILDRSRYVLQTTSGIPFKDFNPSVWNIQLYGTYTGPIPIFKYRYEADLARAYEQKKDVKPLPFGIGYHAQLNTSNLLFAERKEPPSSRNHMGKE